jgi:hypothetical protein
VPERLAAIDRDGIDGVLADPDRPGSILEHVNDVSVLALLLGSMEGDPAAIAPVHGPRLERLIEKLVDTPVRGVVYEGAGTVRDADLEAGARTLRAASERWRIPVRLLDAEPGRHDHWLSSAQTAVRSFL